MKTKVMFRTDRRKNGEVTAVFPAIAATRDPFTLQCYAHIGQHGACSQAWLWKSTRPATPEESAPLRAELESLGYDLHEVKRATRADFLARLEQTRA